MAEQRQYAGRTFCAFGHAEKIFDLFLQLADHNSELMNFRPRFGCGIASVVEHAYSLVAAVNSI